MSAFFQTCETLLVRSRWWPALLLIPALLFAGVFFADQQELEQQARQAARQQARLLGQILQSPALWAGLHGGEPHPATLTEQFGPLHLHLRSRQPLNPRNAADPWEAEALAALAAGAGEIDALVGSDDARIYRHLQALPLSEACRGCHLRPGQDAAELSAGLSLSLAAPQAFADLGERRARLLHGHLRTYLLIAGLLLGGLLVIRRHVLALRAERDQRRQTAQTLSDKLAELELARDELVNTEKIASLGRMVAGFAHEVNTPVGVAVGAASHLQDTVADLRQLIAQEEVHEEDLVARLDILEESAELTLNNLRRASGLVQSFKRTSIDQISGQVREFPLAEFIGDIERNLHNVFKRTQIRIESEYPAELRLKGPVGALEQLLTNLIMNAHQHAFDDGSLAGQIRVEARLLDKQQLQLTVSDNGSGMAEDTVAKIFEPFFTTRRNKGGSGLGLYIVFNIATRMLGGSIQCSSRLGQGSRFTLNFPLQAAVNAAGRAYYEFGRPS